MYYIFTPNYFNANNEIAYSFHFNDATSISTDQAYSFHPLIDYGMF